MEDRDHPSGVPPAAEQSEPPSAWAEGSVTVSGLPLPAASASAVASMHRHRDRESIMSAEQGSNAETQGHNETGGCYLASWGPSRIQMQAQKPISRSKADSRKLRAHSSLKAFAVHCGRPGAVSESPTRATRSVGTSQRGATESGRRLDRSRSPGLRRRSPNSSS